MSVEQDKAEIFVGRLWNNPSLSGLSPLQKEEQLLQFLDVNSGTLEPTLTSPAFFPDYSWSRIFELLKQSLSDFVNKSLSPLYEAILEKKMDFSFTVHMAHRSSSPSAVKNQLGGFLNTLSGRMNSRKELAGPLMGVGTGMIDRYMERIFKRQKYISFELRKVQRLKMSSNEVTDLVKATMLIRPSVQFFAPGGQNSGSGRNLLLISPTFAGKVASEAGKTLSFMPYAVVKAGVNSALSFQDNPYMESTARLAAVFSHRCRNLKPGMKVDRGAESSDKSWFNVARKNYKFYGFDLDMLMELHGIAAENGW
ncbi:MAG: hypothetical protein DRP49_07990 [Spirochaetes bacterium]|nr:MAG: hypothetical protein DRP49_07990 [Spirochaetota bacterium]